MYINSEWAWYARKRYVIENRKWRNQISISSTPVVIRLQETFLKICRFIGLTLFLFETGSDTIIA